MSEHNAKASRGPPPLKAKITVYAGFLFALAPMIAAVTATFRIRKTTDACTTYTWGMEAWNAAWAGNLSTLSVTEALTNSMIFAIGTLFVALPLGWRVFKGA